MASQKSKVPWSQIQKAVESLPLYAPYRTLFAHLGSEWPTPVVWNRVAQSRIPDFGLTFVAQVHVSARAKKKNASLRSYIDQIVQDGVIPTRFESVHDLFNALTFLLFPKLKFSLMKLHDQESRLMADSTPKTGGRGRSRVQDLATLFDEGGSISFGQRPEDVLVFGHGILEQFIFHAQPVRAYCWHWPESLGAQDSFPAVASERWSKVDQVIAQDLITALQTSDFSQLSGEWVPAALTLPKTEPLPIV